jgi:hypothetical protein
MPNPKPFLLLAYFDGNEENALKSPRTTDADSDTALKQGNHILFPSSFSSEIAEEEGGSKF